MHFAHPQYLWLLLLIVPYVVWYIYKWRKQYPSIQISTIAPIASRISLRKMLLHVMFGLRCVVMALLIVIIARPQTTDSWSTSKTEGTDIVLAMDISTSMLARDFKPDRFEAAKEIASKFVSGRESDNIGLVIFAGESFTALPMTTDRQIIINFIRDLQMGMLQDGTAIGDGLATSINRIKEGKAKSKSIILLTDGSNNTGNVAPLTAAEIAKKLGIKVYTIGVGSMGTAPYPAENDFGHITFVNMPVVIDEPSLQKIADTTGGKYFRATNNKVLSEIFQEIDQLEKTSIDVKNFSHKSDNYYSWAFWALILLFAELVVRNTVLRSIP